ncbi:MAG: 4'-phosphopantetheinyl transferase superfamily protein [Bacteriovorax sp.]|nr:4'-phosphopantetheinyl transferase superfamily protein [Bacteriovorax sp.]
MNEQASFLKLFSKSSFFALKKEEDLNLELKNLQQKLQISESVNSYHPNRKSEFILGRLCASKAYKAVSGEELLLLPSQKDRAPLWPDNVVGSIAHDKNFVGAAVAKKSDLIGIGIDFEESGRTKIELSSHIRSSSDLKFHSKLTDVELLTIIFSAKESLYKALYPSVQKFFGFQDAALRSIDLDNGEFEIELLTQLTHNFGPNSRKTFHGRFIVLNKTCLTVLEVSSF